MNRLCRDSGQAQAIWLSGTDMWALIDCNNFFASVERVFHPGLAHRPVCVLSSNDGIIVALTSEAKALGLKRGDVLFKVRDIIERNNVAVFSNNMTLYYAMSRRVTSIIRKSVSVVENYSIDECFADLAGYERHYNLEEFMRGVAQTIKLYTDIPVSIGIAPTKTLAKIGSRFAKRYPAYRSVCMIDSEEKRRKALAMSDIRDVWGIGRSLSDRLRSQGICTPLEFADRPLHWVKSHFNSPVQQTWNELNGRPCIDTAEVVARQSITTSRSFGEMVSDINMIRASVASFSASCAGKLRGQHGTAGSVTVFLCSNPFRDDLEQYGNSGTVRFTVPTADTAEITSAALSIAERIFRPGIMYKKSGVILQEISQSPAVQQELFDTISNRSGRLELSRRVDGINRRFGPRTVTLAVENSQDRPWNVRSEYRSSNYLTDINGILTVRI